MVFTGTEILFYLLGVLTACFAFAMYKYHKQLHFKGLSWALLISGAFLFLFCMAWSVSSVLEGVPRAASMGLVVFGIPSILLLLLGRRMVLKNK
jgi:RsiW-degrading membrane proteinase PrsW (M82 family)